jgi:hypothetical protein
MNLKVEYRGTGYYFDKEPVLVNGNPLSPERSQNVWNHSPDGFSWGYAGSGPAQLALAVLLEAGLDEKQAVRLHQEFKRDFIQSLPQEGSWSFYVDVEAWATGVRV